MKICIITRSIPVEVEWLIEEGVKRGHNVTTINPLDLVYMQDPEFTITTQKGENILDYDVYLLRATSITNKTNKKVRNPRILIARYLLDHGKVVVDRIEAKRLVNGGKNFGFYRLSQEFLPIFPTVYIENSQTNHAVFEKFVHFAPPFILKDLDGRKGKNIYKVNSVDEAVAVMNANPQIKFLIQPFKHIIHDLRVMVVGGKVLGAMEKVHKKHDFLGNISQGAEGKSFSLTPELTRLALYAAQLDNTELAGVDLTVCDEGVYIMEVNRIPQFRGFTAATGINVAGEIVRYLELQYKES